MTPGDLNDAFNTVQAERFVMEGSAMSLYRHGMNCLRLLLIGLAATMISGCATARTATYYVSTAPGASDSNAGTKARPWRTITHAAAQAKAGDTVLIKAGTYGNEYVVVSNSGSSTKPIVFEGYGGTVLLGTLPNPRTLPAEAEIGFKIKGKNYITVRNLDFTWYFDCMSVEEADHITCDHLHIDKCGSQKWLGHGIIYTNTSYGKILNCTVIDCGGNNVDLARSNHCLVDNLKTLGTLKETDTFATDYYCVMWCCNDCIVQNSYAEDTVASRKGNHGFIIKDLSKTPHSHDNKFIDCKAVSFEECFSVAHLAYNNEFIRCVADSTRVPNTINAALQVRNGAHHNTFRDCTATGRRIAVSLTNYSEGNAVNKDGNKFVNCTLKTADEANSMGVLFWRTSNTVFENCVFDKVNYLARYVGDNTGNSFENCIVTGVKAAYDPTAISYYPFGSGATPYDGTGALAVSYTDFHDNGFPAFSGTGNMSADPKFANQAQGDYHLKSTAGRWMGSAWVKDAEDSPCLDKGDPASSYANEPSPNGGRVNIGGYGNTAKASKSPSGKNARSQDDKIARPHAAQSRSTRTTSTSPNP